MKKVIASFALRMAGWKIKLEGDLENLDRCILVVAPHTSNWEFVLGILAYWKLGKPLKVIIKDTHTKAWYGWLIRKLGGIGINRSQRNNLVDFVNNISKKYIEELSRSAEREKQKLQKLQEEKEVVEDIKKKIVELEDLIKNIALFKKNYKNIGKEIEEYV